jgi:hypothetical protein
MRVLCDSSLLQDFFTVIEISLFTEKIVSVFKTELVISFINFYAQSVL